MKKLLIAIFYFLFFIYAFIFLLPKQEIYYFLENKLSPVFVASNEKVSDKGFVFTLSSLDLAYNSIKTAHVKNASLFLGVFYNNMNINEILVEKSFETFVGKKIKTLQLTQHIFMPHIISINAIGDFGTLNGSINLIKQKISLDLAPSSSFANSVLLKSLQKTTKGYRYETNF